MLKKKTTKINFLEECLFRCIEYCKEYSSFLSDSLLSNLSSFMEKKQKKKYYNNILSNLDGILKKVSSNDEFILLQNDLKDMVSLARKEKYISDSYGMKIISIINSDHIKNLVDSLLKEYMSIEKDDFKLPKLKKKSISLPKENTEMKREITYAYIGDVLYEHMKSTNRKPFVEFNLDSFLYEKELYDECVKKHDFKLFRDLNNYELSKLSPSEKKRRIYVKSMFELDVLLHDLSDSNLSDYFKVSGLLVDNIYSDIHQFYHEQSHVEELMNLTKEVYGSKNHLDYYRKKSKMFLRNIKETDEFDIYYEESVKLLKQHKYSMFSFISSVIPSYEDIILSLNKKIIQNISSNIDLYLENINFISQVFRYMKATDVVIFYQELKHVLTSISLTKKTHSSIVLLQSVICNYLSNLLEISVDEVLKYYLKEEKIF